MTWVLHSACMCCPFPFKTFWQGKVTKLCYEYAVAFEFFNHGNITCKKHNYNVTHKKYPSLGEEA